ncbi:MAG: ferredoxin [Mollicutes bacterium]|nr:ferredoxin [Mollicutes bacterium]
MERVRVNKDECIGCGACQAIAPNVFSLNDKGFAEVIKDKIPEELTADVMDALENCPTNAIEEVNEDNKKE